MVAADNIHALRYRDVPLCVACPSCGHRSLMEADSLRGLGKDLHDIADPRHREAAALPSMQGQGCEDARAYDTARGEAVHRRSADMTLKKALALNITFAAMSVMAGVLTFLQIF